MLLRFRINKGKFSDLRQFSQGGVSKKTSILPERIFRPFGQIVSDCSIGRYFICSARLTFSAQRFWQLAKFKALPQSPTKL